MTHSQCILTEISHRSLLCSRSLQCSRFDKKGTVIAVLTVAVTTTPLGFAQILPIIAIIAPAIANIFMDGIISIGHHMLYYVQFRVKK